MGAGVMWLRRRRLPLALIGAVVLAGSVVLVASTNDSGRHPPRAAARWQTGTFDGVTLRFPAGWHAVPVEFNPLGGADVPVGYLVNRPPIEQCRPDGGCRAPIEMSGDASVVTIGKGTVDPAFRSDAMIDGWPAMVRSGECGRGSTYGRSVTLLVYDTESVDVAGCTASTDPVPDANRPVPGLVTLEPVGRGSAVVVSVDRAGAYSVKVARGRYVVTGNSPRIQGGRADCLARQTPVVARYSVRANVICEIN